MCKGGFEEEALGSRVYTCLDEVESILEVHRGCGLPIIHEKHNHQYFTSSGQSGFLHIQEAHFTSNKHPEQKPPTISFSCIDMDLGNQLSPRSAFACIAVRWLQLQQPSSQTLPPQATCETQKSPLFPESKATIQCTLEIRLVARSAWRLAHEVFQKWLRNSANARNSADMPGH